MGIRPATGLRAPGFERYTRATTRSFPIMRLVPVAGPA